MYVNIILCINPKNPDNLNFFKLLKVNLKMGSKFHSAFDQEKSVLKRGKVYKIIAWQ